MRTSILAILLALSLPSESAVDGPAAPAHTEPVALTLGVMTFNIRFGTADDGQNSWPNRNQFVFDVIREHDMDTFNGWTGRTDGPKIDYVLVPPTAIIQDAGIIRTSRDGRYPSDHFPVWAKLQIPAPADGR
ncbi:MAG: hypothetical protein IID31_06380 [Planctomycetes bacterium]|nr:hypothetical protein [Planctomycetota bacterium]